jgi:hypothetical protein
LNNSGDYGGAIFASGATFTPLFSSGHTNESISYEVVDIEHSNISYNSAAYGGGVYLYEIGSVLDDVTIQGNGAAYGGGIYQWKANTFLVDSDVVENLATTGSGIRLFDNGNVTNHVACENSNIMANEDASNTSGAIHISGIGSSFRSGACILGGNNSTYDMYQSQSGGSALSAQYPNSNLSFYDRTIGTESCQAVTDANGNGLVGYDEPTCIFPMEENILSSAVPTGVGHASCSNVNASNPMDSAVVPFGDMNFSGCVTTEVAAGHNDNMYVSLMTDTTEQDCISDLNNTGYTTNSIEMFVERSQYVNPEKLSTRVTVAESDPTNFQVSTTVDFGYDCDGNCCYDILMMDSFGDGWNGAELNIFQGLTLIDTVTLDDGASGWDTFCVDSGALFFLGYDNTSQQYDDTETFVLMQGDGNNGQTICTVSTDLTYGLVTDCGPTTGGGMTCQ